MAVREADAPGPHPGSPTLKATVQLTLVHGTRKWRNAAWPRAGRRRIRRPPSSLTSGSRSSTTGGARRSAGSAALVKEADPDVVEEWKWRGVPTWYHDGMICTGETYKSVVKMTFAKGAALEDPSGLFNSSLEGNVRRAIDFHEGEKINEKAFKALIRAAVTSTRPRSRNNIESTVARAIVGVAVRRGSTSNLRSCHGCRS